MLYWSKKSIKPVLVGLVTALVGLVASQVPPLADLETDLGLALLFALRGPRTAPAEVMVIAIDRESAHRLRLSNIPRHWPRSLHGRLVEKLAREGAGVIVFDIHFREAGDPVQNALFADAIRAAGNVVLFEYMEEVYLEEQARQLKGSGVDLLARDSLQERIPPVAEIDRAAAASVPFPLPAIPHRVNWIWQFLDAAGDMPTLPVVAFAIYALPQAGDWLRQLRDLANFQIPGLAEGAAPTPKNAEALLQALHQMFQADPLLRQRLLLQAGQGGSADSHSRSGSRLFGLFKGRDRRYLDFYGPPRSITTIPYYRALQEPLALAGKAVFIGFSENFVKEQPDHFYTVFSLPDGLDLSGVEIAATAFANLLEDRRVEPLEWPGLAMLLAAWGALIGILFYRLPAVSVAPVVVALVVAYTASALLIFNENGSWLPLAVPLGIQLPFALLAALLWRYWDSRREYRTMFELFGYFLPGRVVAELVRDPDRMSGQGRLVEGICMATDADRFTALSTRLHPERLRAVMNSYFARLFEPVSRNGGFISDVAGDCMIAVWELDEGDGRTRRARACEAALEILAGVGAFNQHAPDTALPTRIGLHCGTLSLGNVGAGRHYEYRALGDVVNTAARIESLNKQLGTRLLASEPMLAGLQGFVSRELGSFVLAGREEPLTIYELIGRTDQVSASEWQRCERFALGLQKFRLGRWGEAVEAFQALLQHFPKDGPARFYLQLCQQSGRQPPDALCKGVIHLDRK